MAKYTLSYACGHGTFEKNMVGPIHLRGQKATWIEANTVCPACYKARQDAAAAELETLDATAPQTVSIKINTHNNAVELTITVTGKLIENQASLIDAGFKRHKTTQEIKFASEHKFTSVADLNDYLVSTKSSLNAMGYDCSIGIAGLDVPAIEAALAKISDMAAKKTADLAETAAERFGHQNSRNRKTNRSHWEKPLERQDLRQDRQLQFLCVRQEIRGDQ